MKTIAGLAEIEQFISECKAAGKSIGFVPTMGALHRGHTSLIEQSKKDCDLTICSIFVNPKQFNNPDDFNQYPRDLEDDKRQLEQLGCDVLFVPEKETVFPPDYKPVQIELGHLGTIMEANHRPGHFEGVVAVVARLFELIQPDHSYFGRKDYQQFFIIQKLVELRGYSVKVTGCPTIRESSGLAMSSRNQRLSKSGAARAAEIYQSLQRIKKAYSAEKLTNELLEQEKTKLQKEGIKPEYLQIAKADSLQPTTDYTTKDPLIAFIAAYVEGVRLIDNLKLNP